MNLIGNKTNRTVRILTNGALRNPESRGNSSIRDVRRRSEGGGRRKVTHLFFEMNHLGRKLQAVVQEPDAADRRVEGVVRNRSQFETVSGRLRSQEQGHRGASGLGLGQV